VKRAAVLVGVYLALQVVALFALPALTALVFGDLLPRLAAVWP
jgi:hypothetical protein